MIRCAECSSVLVGAALLCTVCQPALDTETRLALLEGQARDPAEVVDEMRCQLIDCQRRLQALESVESRIQGFPAALCEPEEVRQ